MSIIVLHGKKELEEIKIEDFSSLKSLALNLYSVERITLRNLIGVRDLKFELVESPINSEIHVKLFDQLPNIQKLTLIGKFSNFNLDNLFSLQELSLKGSLDKEFNYDLFKNLCNQLIDLSIDCSNFDSESMNKLFFDHHFQNLSKLRIMNTKIDKLENIIFSLFKKLDDLKILKNKQLKTIDYDSFTNLKQLTRISLTENAIESFDKRHFSELTNLEYLKLSELNVVSIEENIFENLRNLTNLDLSYCGLENLNPRSFIGLRQLETLDLRLNNLKEFDLRILDNLSQIKIVNLSGNWDINKNEILNHKNSNIEFKFSTLLL